MATPRSITVADLAKAVTDPSPNYLVDVPKRPEMNEQQRLEARRELEQKFKELKIPDTTDYSIRNTPEDPNAEFNESIRAYIADFAESDKWHMDLIHAREPYKVPEDPPGPPGRRRGVPLHHDSEADFLYIGGDPNKRMPEKPEIEPRWSGRPFPGYLTPEMMAQMEIDLGVTRAKREALERKKKLASGQQLAKKGGEGEKGEVGDAEKKADA